MTHIETTSAPRTRSPDRSVLGLAAITVVSTGLALGASILFWTLYLDAWEASLSPNEDGSLGGLIYLLSVPIVLPLFIALVALLAALPRWSAARNILAAAIIVSLLGTLGYGGLTLTSLFQMSEPGALESLLATLVPALLLAVPFGVYQVGRRS